MLLQVKGLIQITAKLIPEKFCARFCHVPNILLRYPKYRAQKRLCTSTEKRNELKVHVFLNDNKLGYFANRQDSFQKHNFVYNV